MNDNVTTHKSFIVTYEPIELHSQINYNRKSFINRFKVISSVKENSNEKSNLVEGNLFLDDKTHRLLFQPLENDSHYLDYYCESFRKKYSIDFNNIKQIVFLTQKNEYLLKSKDIPNKSFRSFSIYCHDFRVYNFNRRYKYLKDEAVDFYQSLVKSVLDYRKQPIRFFDFSYADQSRLMHIYKENINDDIVIQMNVTKTQVSFVPKMLCDRKKFKYNYQFPPQILLHLNNGSFLLVCEKPDSKYTTDVCHRISKAIVGKEIWNHSIFYLNSDGNNGKSEIINPSNKDVLDNFEKLYSMCTPRNKDEFKRIDKKWQSKLSESGWLVLVHKCLQSVTQIINALNSSNSFVYLMESSCPIWSWFFSSLSQIILQPSSRTLKGFISMIKKNWIISCVFNIPENSINAIFVLFLDCVYQLLRKSPSFFEFNEEMLICLYDLLVISSSGLMIIAEDNFEDIDWERFYVKEVVDCFLNRSYDGNTQWEVLIVPDFFFYDFECFWVKMYTRWIPYMQIESGGLSLRHYTMTYLLDLQDSVHSNYPFSLNYDKITKYNDSCNDDAKSINTIISDEF